MAKKENRTFITLVCTECKNKNYLTSKNHKNNPDRIDVKKHCNTCKKHTVHREEKQ